MSDVYIFLAPLAVLMLIKRIKRIVYDIKIKNNDKLKCDTLFLFLIILVIFILVYIIERV